jgi:hypothetical protein
MKRTSFPVWSARPKRRRAMRENSKPNWSILRQVQKRIERGYPYWDRFRFEAAVDACGDACNWHVLSETVTPEYVFGHGGVDVRLPLAAQEAYRHAVDSGLFERFEVCATFETEGDAVVAARYYLFGSSDFETMSAVLFHIADW